MDTSTKKTQIQLAMDDFEREGLDFYDRWAWNNENGWAINTPYAFGMGYFYREGDETVLFVEYARGDIGALMRFCLNIKIDKIELMRNASGRIKRYDFLRFMRLL